MLKTKIKIQKFDLYVICACINNLNYLLFDPCSDKNNNDLTVSREAKHEATNKSFQIKNYL